MNTIGSHVRLRWLIRQEHARLTRLGENPTTAIAWAVTPIQGRARTRQPLGTPTYFASRAAAFRYVDQETRRIYGKATR